ncbi:MAG: hypothetical protein IKP54_00800 [Bacteroidales bacterium]|nr:hypothetical protein [Bacteroidales bacterium]
MKNLGIFILMILCFACNVCAQTDESLVIEQTAQIIAVDPQGNIYAVNNASLYKYAPNGTLLYSYTQNLDGNITSIDVDNPLKIMLFYRDAGTILFLNDKLSPIGDAIDLFAKGLTTINLATYSTKNQIILYDEANTDLIILDFYFNEKERIHYNFKDFNPVILKDINEQKIYMQDQQNGIYFFDSFGTYDKSIAILSGFPVQVSKDVIFFVKNNQLYSYNYLNLEAHTLTDLPEETQQVLVYQNKIILSNGKIISINKLK